MKRIIIIAVIASLFFTAFFYAGYLSVDFLLAKNSELKTLEETPGYQSTNLKNLVFCSENENLSAQDNACQKIPKFFEPRGIEIDLTEEKIFLFENSKVFYILNIAYQAPEEKWFKTPTGYFKTGTKREIHFSSLFPVIMPFSVQLYEDFFIHEIPYYKNGDRVSSNFTGGCIRLETNEAKTFYDFIERNDRVIVYKTFEDLILKDDFLPPVDLENFWIRQRFGNPIRHFRNFSGDLENLKLDYYQHTGIDFAPNPGIENALAYAMLDGKISKIQLNDGSDHGLGNTVILEHEINEEKIYFLYSHLKYINPELTEGSLVLAQEIIGEIGNSGFGCQNYWRIDADGCDKNTPADTHLHLEIKKAPVLENPEKDRACLTSDKTPRLCYGYTPDYPQKYGYYDPIDFLFTKNQ